MEDVRCIIMDKIEDYQRIIQDLEPNNWYINDGLEYPIPERLIQYKNTTYGEGVIKKKGEFSYHIYHGSNKKQQHD